MNMAKIDFGIKPGEESDSPDRFIYNNEWQLCPKCNGEGILLTEWKDSMITAFSTNETCDLCNGKKIISKVNGQPPI